MLSAFSRNRQGRNRSASIHRGGAGARRIGKSRRSIVGGSWGGRRCPRAARNRSNPSRPCARPAGHPWRPEPGRADPRRFHKRNSSPLQAAVRACANEDRIAAGSSLGLMRRGTLKLVMLCIVSSESWVISHREATVSAGLSVISYASSGVKRQTVCLQGSLCRTGSKKVERLRAEIAVAKELESHWSRTWPRR